MGARQILKPYLTPTPLRQYQSLNRLVGAQVFVKHENHNPTGTFKIRGGTNLMHHLKQRGVGGVITFSTGRFSVRTMAQEGVAVNFLGVLVISTLTYLLLG